MFLNVNSYAGLLNLITVPTAAYLLMSYADKFGNKYLPVLFGSALVVLTYAIGITKGRGALLGFILAMVLVLGVASRHVSWRAIVRTLLLIVLALGLANLSPPIDSQPGLVERLQTLSDPVSAGWERFRIWQASWELLQEAPWRGIGLGIYSLAWPPYRHPDDGTAGFFAHNDYLHLWIEAGLPGLILFVAVLASAFWIFVRTLRRHKSAGTEIIELTGLIAAVMAIAFHSLVDFNFYIIPILILTGLAFARIQYLADGLDGAKAWVIEPRRWVTRGGYRIIVVLLLAFPLLYFVTLALSAFETRRAVEFAQEGRLDEAEITLVRAARFYPYADSTLMSHADLYRHALTLLPSSATEDRRVLFERANELLDDALKLNPLRVQIFVVRAQLYEQNRELTGKEWPALARAQYDHALRLNPRHFEARFFYARLLHSMGESDHALTILEAGLRYSHISHVGLLPYYALTAELRAREGDLKGAGEMQQQVKELQHKLDKMTSSLKPIAAIGTP
jgi:tetratricopeptide (TPR) repeat protein